MRNFNPTLRWACICLAALSVFSARASGAVNLESVQGAWLFDESTGSEVLDSSGKEHHGRFTADDIQRVDGMFDRGLEFFGGGEVVVPHDDAFTSPTFTLMGWVKVPQIPTGWTMRLMAKDGWPDRNYGMYVAPSSGVVHFAFCAPGQTDVGNVNGNTAIADGQWHHVAMTYDLAARRIYVDGELDQESPMDIVPSENTVDIQIGTGPVGIMDEVLIATEAFAEEDVKTAMQGGLMQLLGGPTLATRPAPANRAEDVIRDVALTWQASAFAVTHNVYFDTSLDAINTDDPSALLAEGLDVNALDIEMPLDFGQTYYWRVDEVNGAPDFTVFKGDVWSFTVEPFSYPIETVTAMASSAHATNMGPERTINGVGLNAEDQHSVDGTTMWLSAMGDAQPWLQYEFDRAQKLHEMWVWNSNQIIESFIGLGAKDVTVETSINGIEWTRVENVAPFAQASGSLDYTANTIVNLGGAYARFVRLTITSAWGALPQLGISELRFFSIPTFAREPEPIEGAALDGAEVVLAWRAGREAASHQIYLGTDPQDLPLAVTTTEDSYGTGALDYATTYYWSVTEVNEAEAVSAYAGDTWSFATPSYGIVDDFEQYDEDCNWIFFAWEDGWGHNGGEDIDDCDVPPFAGNGGGSIVGDDGECFVPCRTIAHVGSAQAMPFNYDNAFGLSEATLTVPSEDWAAGGVRTLALAFHGTVGNTGRLYIKINNSKIAYDGDAGDIGISTWQPWNIDLTGLSGLDNVTSLTIGVDGDTAAGKLYIDDIRLYPLAGEMITPVDPGSANLLAHYAFEGNPEDSSGNAYHGVEYGTVTYAAGVIGQALSLNGFASYVRVDTVGISGTAPRSIAGWAKASTDALADWINVFGFTGPNSDGQHFDIEIVGNTGTTTSGYFGLHRHGWEMDITANDEEWHHLAGTFDGSVVNIYGDGRLVNTGTAHNVNTPGPVHMGKRLENDTYFEGLVDDVRIYDRALTSEEIAWIAGKRTPLHKGF